MRPKRKKSRGKLFFPDNFAVWNYQNRRAANETKLL